MGEIKKIKLVDCTLRDGGLLNNWDFSDEFVEKLLNAYSKANIDYVELGYKTQDSLKCGKWRYCYEDELKKFDSILNSKVSFISMVDVERYESSCILPREKSIFCGIRVASYLEQIDEAISILKELNSKGYDVFLNIMAITKCDQDDLRKALKKVSKLHFIKAVYIVDSFGTLYYHEIEGIVKLFREFLAHQKIGIHTHNNQQMAFANTVEAIRQGVEYIDASLFGMGRAAGNCPIELLLLYLKDKKYNVGDVLDIIYKEIPKIISKQQWGYLIPYVLTGAFNKHPSFTDMKENKNFKDIFEDFLKHP